MKTKKLLTRIGDVLNGEARKKDLKKSALRKLLANLEEKESILRKRLGDETDKRKSAKFDRKIKLLRAQRKKGCQALDACD